MICPNCGHRTAEEQTISGGKVAKVLKYIAEEGKKKTAKKESRDKFTDRDFTGLVIECIKETNKIGEAIELFCERGGFNTFNTAKTYFYKFKPKMRES